MPQKNLPAQLAGARRLPSTPKAIGLSDPITQQMAMTPLLRWGHVNGFDADLELILSRHIFTTALAP